MLDINRLRKDFDNIVDRIKTRGKNYPALEQYKSTDLEWRKLTSQMQELNTKRNLLTSDMLQQLKNKDTVRSNQIRSKVQQIKQEIDNIQTRLNEIGSHFNTILHSIPNIPHESVPKGINENDNIEISKWGKPAQFKFNLLSHWEIAEKRDFIDFVRATKMSGTRFSIYKGNGAKLMRALQNFTLDMNVNAGFNEILPPTILNATTLLGTGQLPKFEEDLFKLTNDQYLSPTSEVQLTSLYANEILPEKMLPIHFTANTSCFRREAGSAGKDTKGVIRQHQFYKTETVMITKPTDSYASLEKMLANAKSILEKLNLPYRVVLLCTGDLGFASAKTYDIEVWLPSYKNYKEISSCSNCEDFQTRNLMLRYKDANNGKLIYPHSLNGSALAIDRLWAAVIENYQLSDGSIKIPDALNKYFDDIKSI